MADRGKQGRVNLFSVTAPICAAVAGAGIFVPDLLSDAAEVATGTSFRALDWFFMATTTAFLVLSVWLALSRFGRIKLGQPGDRPEFSTASWLSMLFAAGMGVGIMFWGVAEPLTHFSGAPGSDPGTALAARRALVITSFHWGLHAWAVYAIAALALGYFAFRKNTPYLPGSPIRAAFSGRWVGSVSTIADAIAVLSVVFGVAGAITMGILQLRAGLSIVAGIDGESIAVAVVLLIVIVVAFMLSAATSLDKGIKWLSNINLSLAILLVLFILFAGPTSFLLRTFITSVGDYVSGLVSLSLRLYPYGADHTWLEGWTLTYFIWWIAWAPFVGVFIARISRGRTIREFVTGVLFVPTLFTLIWFAVFGGTGLFEELSGAGGLTSIVREDVTLALYAVFERLPLSAILGVVSLILVFVFLVTSADSATFVLGMLTSRGSLDPPRKRKLAWGVSLGLLAGALLLSGNIDAIRAVSIIGAIPFTFILLLHVAALVRTLRKDHDQEDV